MQGMQIQDGRLARVVDIAIALLLLLTTFPLIVFTATAIKCESRGPIFEWQQFRRADGGRLQLLTFRTARQPSAGRASSTEHTRLGEFLRYTRIDRLPQVINLLRGDISLFGSGDSKLGRFGF